VLRGEEPPQARGNLLLDRLLGAEVVWAGERDLVGALEETAEKLREAGRHPYVVPYGGSNPVGIGGYVVAAEELLAQCQERDLHFDHVVLASSSGGTQAGLEVGARALACTWRILGISVDLQAGDLQSLVSRLANQTARRLGLGIDIAPADLAVDGGYLGGGYGVVGDLERKAIRTLARTEGVLLDPVYTGRAFGGLLDLVEKGALRAGERVLFWHTGGTAALFGFEEELA
jgi:D-cysteine desulfhydrase